MREKKSEKPGAQTPWTEINHLLAADERFELHEENWNGFLLAPKHSSSLAALLYLLSQQALAFCVQGKGTRMHPEPHHRLVVSARAFSQVAWHEQRVVEIGAGCSLFHLQQFLFERQQEMALEEYPWISLKQSVGGFLLAGQTSGIRYKQETIPETILGVELVTWEGHQIKWGGQQRSAVAGPALHKLIWGLQTLPGIITKVILKTYPIPQKRLRLTWSFRKQEALWEHLELLKAFSFTWESLDCVLSGQKTEQGFIFAQIAGLSEEMEAFAQLCPLYATARQQEERVLLKNYLYQQKLKAYYAPLDHSLKSGEYLWYQELDQQAWWLTSQEVKNLPSAQPLWKQRFWKSLCAYE